MAVKTNIFPLYEIENGEKYTVNKIFKNKTPVSEYMKLQKIYRYTTEDTMEKIQQEIDRNWNELMVLSSKNI